MASNGESRMTYQRDGAMVRQESGAGIDIPQNQLRPSQSSTQIIVSESMIKEVQDAIDKLLNKVESPPKEKHIRSVIIATWKEQGCNVFWTSLSKHDLASQALVCWKAIYVLHRVLRDGHSKSISRSTKYLSYLNTLQKRWAMFQGGYNKLSLNYLRVVIEKIKFHIKYPMIPATFKVELQNIKFTSGDHLFQMEVDILEYESALLSLQGAVFGELDPSKGYTTQVAQCRVAPLVPVIEDQNGLYDLSYHVMQLLHSNLPAELLAGHRDRYYRHYSAMRKFLLSSRALSYVSTLTKIRELALDPPVFVVEENFPSEEIMSPLSEEIPPEIFSPHDDDESGKDELIEQLLRENLELKQKLEELEENAERRDQQMTALASKINQMKVALEEMKKARDTALEDQQRLTIEIESQRERTQMEADLNKQKAKLDETLEKAKKMYFELREEHVKLLRTHGQLKQSLSKSNEELSRALKDKSEFEGQLQHMHLMVESKNEHEYLLQSEMQEKQMESEGESAQYRQEIAQLMSTLEVAEAGAVRQSDLESELNTLNISCSDLEQRLSAREQELEITRAEFMNKTATYEAELTHNSTRVQQLELELSEFKKDDTVMIEDQVEAEMAQTTLAVDQAALRIQEILEASKSKLTGIKLEVNGNILGACTGLMAAIKLLIEKSKNLQREILSEGGEHSSKEFYRKNHRWTEGLISAAKIVGQGATYLVDTADRCVDGRASYQELMVVSKDISASTVQLVVTSQVKADKESSCLKEVKGASGKVSESVGQVIASAQVGAHQIEENVEIDFTNLSYVRAKKLERDMSINVLELESKLEKARVKLSNLRKSTYHTSEGATEGSK